jgi:hypothetical protein
MNISFGAIPSKHEIFIHPKSRTLAVDFAESGSALSSVYKHRDAPAVSLSALSASLPVQHPLNVDEGLSDGRYVAELLLCVGRAELLPNSWTDFRVS